MNKTTKPISSPGRSTEKFPPPLMRFLRSNVGSKSRRRSRASPMSMFVKKKNTPFETTIQEPSSPKVTCIGQVRVRRSNKKKNHNHRLCRCLRTVKSFSLITVWSKCVMFFRCVSCCCCGCCSNNNHAKKHLQHQKEKQIQQEQQEHHEEKQEDQGDIERRQQHKIEQEITKHVALHVDDINVGLIPKTPPKNAFLLTRCRSAPYRSANSLASMFKESMVENDHESKVEEKIKIEKEDEIIKKFKIKKEDENEGEDDEEGTSNESDGCEESKVVPLILSRCKSEPARTWDQLHLV